MSKFYTVRQNNSGGYNIQNDEVDKYVCVEANNIQQAQDLFDKILDGYREYCPCCGERWNDDYLDEDDATDIPTIYGENYKKFNDKFFCRNNKIIIYYLDGNIERYELKQNIKGENNDN